MLSRLTQHFTAHNLHEPLQSAYRKYHGTETALLRVQNDLLRSMDQGQAAFLVLLDLSSAFDTIDHAILLERLQSTCGIVGAPLAWIKSYLEDRTQSVTIDGTLSDKISLKYGVPQGSVLGPQFFVMYSSPIASIARKHGLSIHLYADDTQIYAAFRPGSPVSEEHVRMCVQDCVAEMKAWMTMNKLMLNDDKTELLVIASPHQRKNVTTEQITIGNSTITASASARNLGMQFDNMLTMADQVKAVCQSAYYQIHNINSIRRCLDQTACETLVNALVTSRLDAGNSLLYHINGYLLDKLQRVQNASARVIAHSSKREHISPILRKLHWLPVRKRIDFKLLLLTWKALNNAGPEYIGDMLEPYIPSRTLRSSTNLDLVVPRSRRSQGDRAFSIAAPRLWNTLPLDIRTATSVNIFKNKLKTWLFTDNQ